MRWMGILLVAAGLLIGVLISGNPASFVNVPGLLFVLLVGCGVILAGHGAASFSLLIKTLADRQASTDDRGKQTARQVLETGVQAFVAAGWIGVLIGVVQMLSALDDPAQIGLGMATCLLTALYGYVLAYLVCLPLARSMEGDLSQGGKLNH